MNRRLATLQIRMLERRIKNIRDSMRKMRQNTEQFTAMQTNLISLQQERDALRAGLRVLRN